MITKSKVIETLQQELLKAEDVQLMKIWKLLRPTEDLYIHNLNEQTFRSGPRISSIRP